MKKKMVTTAIFLSLLLIFLLSQTGAVLLLTEIQALTSFKLGLQDPFGALSGWDPTTPLAPCDWRGVSCNEGRVTELRLPGLKLAGELTDRLASLSQLRKLSLHSNDLNGTVPTNLPQCSLLRSVYLQNNSLWGPLPPSLFNLTNLQDLNLAHNRLNGTLPASLTPSLRFLDVSSNSFTGEIPSNFTSASQLQLINFSYNNFSGGVPGSIGLLQGLQYLWLDYNGLAGSLPSALANCSSLVHVSAEGNELKGVLPGSIGSLPKLEVLSLSRNQLSGSVPASLFCGGLRIVNLGANEFTGVVGPSSNGVKCVGALEVLDLHGNRIDGEFPTWLTGLTSIRVVDLSGNFLSGEFPVDVGNFTRVEELRVANNSLTGSIPSWISQCGSLQVLDLHGNRFSGEVPSFLGEIKSLKILSLGGNLFSGDVPSGLGGLTKLESLRLGSNNLSGYVPEEILNLGNLSSLDLNNNGFSGEVPWGIGNLTGLVSLNLSGCGFSGAVPSSIGKLLKLATLDLSRQNLSGALPAELFGLPSLQVVALEENMLSGDVPEGLSSLVDLHYLNLSFNRFTGEIPTTYGFLRSLVVLSLSGNLISGEIPSELGNFSSLEVLELRSNRLKGIIPGEVSRITNLKELDLGENSLSGKIPEEIYECSSLETLLLDDNHLSGEIPDSLSKLSNLQVLNLSSNNLGGPIPANLSLISGLRYLNLSRNDLEGKIPSLLGSRFSDPSVFAMNGELCGKPLGKECPKAGTRKRKKVYLLIGVAVAGIVLMALCCSGYIYSLLLWRKKLRQGASGEKKRSPGRASSGTDKSRSSSETGVPKLIMFNNRTTYAETLEATRHFDEENVLSRSRYGLVFKASYQDGMVLSVRRLPNGSIAEGTFRKEAEYLGKVKHRNLTVLRGYFLGPPDVRLLVYDYMPNGNLGTLLQEATHQDGHVLNWPMRHLIALGIARGLAFLHSIPIVHGDVKPQHVLFDADFEAHLSEFGLDKLVSPSLATPVGSLGYMSPEVALSGEASKEADVYSFGIVLLEILTGRKPVMFTEDEDIVKWVKRQLQRGQVSELLDPGLLELDPESSEWEEFLLGIKVGLLCTATDPRDRPSMTDIVFMLEGCRAGPEMASSADPTTLPSPA